MCLGVNDNLIKKCYFNSTQFFMFQVVLLDGDVANEGNVYATNPATGVFGPICDNGWDLIDVSSTSRL